MPDDLTQIISDEARLPASSQSDGQSATGRTLAELIAADRYLRAIAAASQTNSRGGPRSGWAGLRAAKGRTPGAA